MVSSNGYAITEILFAVGLSYALITMLMLVKLIEYKLKDKNVWKVFGMAVLGLIAVIGIYQTNIRIGTILFIDGVLVGLLIIWTAQLVRFWIEFVHWRRVGNP